MQCVTIQLLLGTLQTCSQMILVKQAVPHVQNVYNGYISAKCWQKSIQQAICGLILVTFMYSLLFWIVWIVKESPWISNHMHNKVWDEITNPFPNFNSCTIGVWEGISNFIPHFIMVYSYLSMLVFKLSHVSKGTQVTENGTLECKF